MSDDHFEPVYGLPGFLPQGERILWQGSPDARSLAWRAFRIREVMIYFAALLAVEFIAALARGEPLVPTLARLAIPAGLGCVACVVLGVLAFLSARTTVYTVTTQRIAIRTGIAFSVTINLPFRLIDSVDLSTRRNGLGDLLLTLAKAERLGYVLAWPNVRPWHWAHPQAMLRGIREAATVGEIVAGAVQQAPTKIHVVRRPASVPDTHREPVAA